MPAPAGPALPSRAAGNDPGLGNPVDRRSSLRGGGREQRGPSGEPRQRCSGERGLAGRREGPVLAAFS